MKRRQTLRDRVLGQFPFCIYRGGMKAATTIGHVPPRAVFDLRHRPKGLEFPACEACDSGGRLDEQVAAMLSRVHPGPVPEDVQAEGRDGFEGIKNRRLGTLAGMLDTSLRERPREGDPDRDRRDPIDSERAMHAIERIGAAPVFGRATTLAIPGSEMTPAETPGSPDIADALPDCAPAGRLARFASRRLDRWTGSGAK